MTPGGGYIVLKSQLLEAYQWCISFKCGILTIQSKIQILSKIQVLFHISRKMLKRCGALRPGVCRPGAVGGLWYVVRGPGGTWCTGWCMAPISNSSPPHAGGSGPGMDECAGCAG